MSITHTVQSGECLSSIAIDYGYNDWEKIYNHEDNSHFRSLRPNPNIIFSGDEIIIPDIVTKTEPVEPDIVNTFVAVGTKPYLNLRLAEHIEGRPLSDCAYQLSYEHNGKEEVKEGILDNEGKLSLKIPGQVKDANITVTTNDTTHTQYSWKLFIGHPDPIDTKAGVAKHLINMGYLEAFTQDLLMDKLQEEANEMSETIENSWRAFSAAVEDRAKAIKSWSPWISNINNQHRDADMAIKSGSSAQPISVVAPETTSLLKKFTQ
ncbi:hypothetical protein A9Q99_25715 [Gammaproteobacteria bacterium 45_16_T64]|nr:hypothetical protein A9Q99_25715 [Gammaproteobacteria bacterium 45_16_T64]